MVNYGRSEEAKKGRHSKHRLLALLILWVAILMVPNNYIGAMPGAVTTASAKGKVGLNKRKVTINRGFKARIKLKNVPSDAKISWNVSNKSVASIKVKGTACVISGKKAGKTKITVKVNKKKFTCIVTVKKKMALSETSKILRKGESFILALRNARPGTVKWRTTSADILRIKRIRKYKYQVFGMQPGTAFVIVRVGNKKLKSKIEVRSIPQDNEAGGDDAGPSSGEGSDKETEVSSKNQSETTQEEQSETTPEKEPETTHGKESETTSEKQSETATEKEPETTPEPLKFSHDEYANITARVGQEFCISTNNKIRAISYSRQDILKQCNRKYQSSTVFYFVGENPCSMEVTFTDVYGQTITSSIVITQQAYSGFGTPKIEMTDARRDNSLPIPEVTNIYYTSAGIDAVCPGKFDGSSPYTNYEGFLCESDKFDTTIKVDCEDDEWNDLGYAYLGWNYTYEYTTYYLKVRSFRTEGTTKVYGPWSEVLQIHVPKYSTKSDLEPVYSYQLYFLDKTTGGVLYDGCSRAVYIKTDNPDPNTIGLISPGSTPKDDKIVPRLISVWGETHYYDDIKYYQVSDYTRGLKKVDGGYVAYLQFEDPGTYPIEVREYTDDGYRVAKSFEWTVRSTEQEEKEWITELISKYTTPSMTPFEKMEAICDYLTTPGVFRYYTESNGEKVKLATTPNTPYFRSYRFDSASSPAALCKIAEQIGGFSDIHNCYYDYPYGTTGYKLNHYYAELTYDGEMRRFEVCPLSYTGDVGEVEYIDFSDTASMIRADR